MPEHTAGPSGSSMLSIRGVNKSFGPVEVLRGISLEIPAGEFLTILGESGSGKTTLLRLLAGFEQPTSGEIWMAGERIDPLPPNRRRLNTVFQSYALFPHLSVFENVAYGLRLQKLPECEIRSRVGAALFKARIQELSEFPPAKISGGQQQRVALARALVNRPQVLLLDEPLSALDANLRRQMQIELKTLQREVGITFIFVTHDQDEAMALSDRIALLRAGRLEQIASPREIYTRPNTAYTAGFIGQTNFLRAEVSGGMARCGALVWPTDSAAGAFAFSLRPECLRLASSHWDPASVRFRARIRQQTFAGATDLLELLCSDGLILRARVPNPGPLPQEAEFEFHPADAVAIEETPAG